MNVCTSETPRCNSKKMMGTPIGISEKNASVNHVAGKDVCVKTHGERQDAPRKWLTTSITNISGAITPNRAKELLDVVLLVLADAVVVVVEKGHHLQIRAARWEFAVGENESRDQSY